MTAKAQATLRAEVDTTFAVENPGDITGAELRGFLRDFIDSTAWYDTSELPDASGLDNNYYLDATGAWSLPGGGGGLVSVDDLITDIINHDSFRQLVQAIFLDAADALSIAYEQFPALYFTEPSAPSEGVPYPLNIEGDPSTRLFAEISEIRSGAPGDLVASLEDAEAALLSDGAVTWDGTETVDIALGQFIVASLEANSTVTLFDNIRGGTDFVIKVLNTGAYSLEFAGGSGITLKAVNEYALDGTEMGVGQGSGAITYYAGFCESATDILIQRISIEEP